MAFIPFAKSPSDFARQQDNDNASKKNEKKGVIVKMSHDSTLSQQGAITDKAIQAAMPRNSSMEIIAITKADCKEGSIDLKANGARLTQARSPLSRLRKTIHFTLGQRRSRRSIVCLPPRPGDSAGIKIVVANAGVEQVGGLAL
jgi:hypothetical protein